MIVRQIEGHTFHQSMIKQFLKKYFVFTDVTLINTVDEGDEIIHYVACKNAQNVPWILKITHDNNGHWTKFDVEYKKIGSEDWFWIGRFNEHVE